MSAEVRRSEIDDVRGIQLLLSNSVSVGLESQRVDPSVYIERNILSLTVNDQKKGIIAFASFSDSAPIPNVLSSEWELWFADNYSLPDIQIENALWLDFIVLQKGSHLDSVLHAIFEFFFKSLPEVNHILFCSPINSKFNSKLFTLLSPNSAQNVDIFMCHRSDVVPQLIIRLAKVEDHDDLVPIFNKKSELNPELHSQYFLASLISSVSPTTSVLVAEVDKRAVGIMSLTSNVDVYPLRKAFALEPFNFLQSSEDAENKTNNGPSAICVTLFCLDERYSSRSIDFIKPAFEQFPGKEYLIMTQPHKSLHTHLHDYFTFVAPKEMANPFQHVLYLLHQNTMDSVLIKEVVSSADALGVKPLVSNLGRHGEDIVRLVHSGLKVQEKEKEKEEDVNESSGNNNNESNNNDNNNNIDSDTNENNDNKSDSTATDMAESRPASLPLNPYLRSFVLLCDSQIVGVAVVDSNIDPAWVSAHYDVDTYVNMNCHNYKEYAFLRCFVIHPIFEYKRTHFLKELMRKNDKAVLYYKVMPEVSRGTSIFSHRAMQHGSIFPVMFPVDPRRQIIYVGDSLQHPLLEPPSPCNDPLPIDMAFSLQLMSRKLLYEPKVTVNTRIVVVGASVTGLGFIDSLLKTAYLNIRNIVLVNPGGMPDPHTMFEPITGGPTPQFFPYAHEFSTLEFLQCGIEPRIRVVDGKMVLIDRERKLISLQQGNCILRYDYLILTSGLQESVTNQLHTSVVEPNTSENSEESDQMNGTQTKQESETIKITENGKEGGGVTNVISLGTRKQHKLLLSRLDTYKPGNKVVVYGCLLEAYTAVQGILTAGVNGGDVEVYIVPDSHNFYHPDKPSFKFNNPHVENKIFEALKSLGVTEQRGQIINRIGVDSHGTLNTVFFKSVSAAEEEIAVECHLLVCCGAKDIDSDCFYAINDACLIYDGRLVVDDKFKTNDKDIYAIGTMTKFSRRFRTIQSFQDYNSREVGHKLAQLFLGDLFNPSNVQKTTDPSPQPLRLKFTQPIITEAVLPGGMFYVFIRTPSKPFPNSKGTDLLTDSNDTYFNIHVDPNGMIDSITYLGKVYIEVDNFKCLIGLSHFYLYHMLDKIFEGGAETTLSPTRKQIQAPNKTQKESKGEGELVNYLRGTLHAALFHDHFPSLRAHLESELLNDPSIINNINNNNNKEENGNLTGIDVSSLREAIKPAKKTLLLRNLISFLDTNHPQLSMYFIPPLQNAT